ncbi:MAG TPA: hypothetical protein VN937_16335 [Blastocatellia bacterium]|nr:hypothetical protein [Blastocatellia bacterium]
MSKKKQPLIVSPGFLMAATGLSKNVKSALIKTLFLLTLDFRHPSLQCKKVQGSQSALYECRVDQKVRLIYDISDGNIRCWYVGEHDVALRFATSHTVGDGEVVVEDVELVDVPAALRPTLEFLSLGVTTIEFDERDLQDFVDQL